MKKITVFILLVFHFNLNASVYDFIRERIDTSMVFIPKVDEKMSVRINGNKMDVSLLTANKSSKEVLETLSKKAEKNGCSFYSNETVLYTATMLYKIAGKKRYEDEFGYIFYRDKKKRATFVITAGDGTDSEIIKITADLVDNGRSGGFDDGIKHISDAEKIFSIEILSEYGRVLYFANFYRTQWQGRYEIRNFYGYSLKKSGFKIKNNFFDDNMDFFVLQKQKRNYLFSISEVRGENWIMVMG